MSYDAVDATLENWGRTNGVVWQRKYRDEEVRSTEVWLGDGVCGQLWLEPVPGSTGFAICAWDRKNRRFRETSEVARLPDVLDHVLTVLRSWAASTDAC